MTTSADLVAYKQKVEAGGQWTPDLQAELFNLVAPVALALQGRTLSAPLLSRCMDNIVVMGPHGWSRSMQELSPGTKPAAVAGHSLWRDGGLKMETYGKGDTLAAAMLAGCATVWAYIIDHPEMA